MPVCLHLKDVFAVPNLPKEAIVHLCALARANGCELPALCAE